MGQCNNCKHWVKENTESQFFKNWGSCPKLSSSSDIEILYDGHLPEPDKCQINTYSDFSCRNWEGIPDSFDELVKENAELQRRINLIIDQIENFDLTDSVCELLQKIDRINEG